MRTIRLEEPGRFALFTNEECATSLNPDEALVRVHRIGICGTDIHAYRGNQPFFRYPRILGHELGVEVVAVGSSSTNVRPGDRCSVEPYLNCGHCIACRRGKTNCCANLQVLGVHTDGGMRDALVVPIPSPRTHPSIQSECAPGRLCPYHQPGRKRSPRHRCLDNASRRVCGCDRGISSLDQARNRGHQGDD